MADTPTLVLVQDGTITHVYDTREPWMDLPGFDIRDASGTPGVEAGWAANADGTFTAPFVPPPTVADLQAYAAKARFAREIGGLTLPGAAGSSLAIATDRDSQSMIANAFAYVQASGAPSIRFKAASGWLELSADQVKAIALAVGAHVQASFAQEDALDAGITAVPPTITTFAQIDAAFAAVA